MRFLGPDLWIGVIVACLRISGKAPCEIDRLYKWVSGIANNSLLSIIILDVIPKLGFPDLFKDLIILMVYNNSSYKTIIKKIVEKSSNV